jgi:hypothetical protein
MAKIWAVCFFGYDKKEEDRSSSFLIMASACRAQLFRFAVVMLSLLAALFPSACCHHPFRLPPSCLAFRFVAIMFSPLASGGCTWLPVPVPAGGECRSDAAAAINI